MKEIAFREISASNKFILAATIVAFFLIMTLPNYSVLAYTEHRGGNNPSSDTMFFRILKGDLNVCSPNYLYNITICQMVMKDDELLPFGGEGTNGTHTNSPSNIPNSTNSNSHPPLSNRPEMVINEEQLQELLANHSLNAPEGVDTSGQNATGTTHSSDPEGESIGKIYVDDYPQFKPLAIEQPLEEEITIDDSLQRPWESNQQTLLLNNQSISNGVHDIEEPWLSKDTIPQEGVHRDSVMTNEGSSLGETTTDNPKADTSNSYSSLLLGMSFPSEGNH